MASRFEGQSLYGSNAPRFRNHTLTPFTTFCSSSPLAGSRISKLPWMTLSLTCFQPSRDNEAERQGIISLLSKEGVQTTAAGTAEEALQALLT